MTVKEVEQAMSAITSQLNSFIVPPVSASHTVPQTTLQESHAQPSEASLGWPSK